MGESRKGLSIKAKYRACHSRASLAVLRRGLLLRGYINAEFVDEHYDSLLREIGPRVRSGDIRYREDIADGLEKAPEAFIGMLAGRNFGKALVRLS
jgi:NADPH-dependent curcumin reductase CurA